MEEIWNSHQKWSEAVFGPREWRGPLGPLQHLKNEVDEVIKEYKEGEPPSSLLQEEFADCAILLFDAVWRAGMSYQNLIDAVQAKHEKNKKRKWPSLEKIAKDDPVFHIKDQEITE